MLVLSMKCGQIIEVGDDIIIQVLRISKDAIRLGIEAPRDVPIYRREAHKIPENGVRESE